jgi:hypothetical protein
VRSRQAHGWYPRAACEKRLFLSAFAYEVPS